MYRQAASSLRKIKEALLKNYYLKQEKDSSVVVSSFFFVF